MKKITVCVRQGADGALGPFDAAAYECALRIPDAEVTLLSMGVAKTAELLTSLSRLGAKRAVLLCDKVFAGADTLATAYTLSLAVEKLAPDLVLCGRQTLIGDTGQVGPMLAELLSRPLIAGVMEVRDDQNGLVALTREGDRVPLSAPTLLTVERSFSLRFPRLGSKAVAAELWSAADISADPARCGLGGSPTRVLATFENQSGKRKCRFIAPEELASAVAEGLAKSRALSPAETTEGEMLPLVVSVGKAPRTYAESVCKNVITLPLTDADTLLEQLQALDPDAVLFASDSLSKGLAATIAARRSLGLCADCTRLEASDGQLIMYRPALSGSLIAKIKSLTRPALATVRTEDAHTPDILVGAGFGVKDSLDAVKALAHSLGGELVVSRKPVDNGYAPYFLQVGLTGRTVCPPVYIAVGISGAVHHIAGIDRSGTVIAINPDRSAPIFDYADIGIVAEFPF